MIPLTNDFQWGRTVRSLWFTQIYRFLRGYSEHPVSKEVLVILAKHKPLRCAACEIIKKWGFSASNVWWDRRVYLPHTGGTSDFTSDFHQCRPWRKEHNGFDWIVLRDSRWFYRIYSIPYVWVSIIRLHKVYFIDLEYPLYVVQWLYMPWTG